jgi:hypothetical protein
MMTKFPSLSNHCYFNFIAPWGSSDASKVVADIIQKESYLEELISHSGTLCNVAAEIHTSSFKLRYFM